MSVHIYLSIYVSSPFPCNCCRPLIGPEITWPVQDLSFVNTPCPPLILYSWKSLYQSCYQDCIPECLNTSLNIKTANLKVLIPVWISRAANLKFSISVWISRHFGKSLYFNLNKKKSCSSQCQCYQKHCYCCFLPHIHYDCICCHHHHYLHNHYHHQKGCAYLTPFRI